MARTKKVVEEQVMEEKVVEVAEEKVEVTKKVAPKEDTEALKAELANEKAENAQMKEQLAQLQQMMLQMQSNQNTILASSVATSVPTRDEKVKIQSYLYGKNVITNTDGNTVLSFKDSGDVATVSNRILDSIMKPETKELFKKGLLGFVGESEKYYEEHDINRPMVLSDENIIKLLELPKEQCIAKLNEITENKMDTQVMVSLFWNAIRLFAKGTIHDANVKYLLAEYFNCPRIDDRIEMVHYAKTMNFIK